MMDIPGVIANEAKDPLSQQTFLNVGKALREAREGLGMSVYDVAERIKFAPKQVEALESNDYARLPKATFLRGFVRSYARVLQLDDAALIAALPSEPLPQNVVKQQVVDVSFPSLPSLRRFNIIWLAAALGVTLVLGLFVWVSDGESAGRSSEVVVEVVPLPVVPDAGASAVAADPTPPVEEMPKVVELRKIEEKAVKPHNVPAPATATVSPATPTTPAPSPIAAATNTKPPVALELLKRRPLHFVFSGSAWIEVVDVNGDVLLSRSNLAGTEKWIGGPRRAPYDISIGNPGNVKMYYKGKEIDLSAYAGMDTARLKVE
jgi:cytoskeleton protein RodZ